jgi:hypothetical protein
MPPALRPTPTFGLRRLVLTLVVLWPSIFGISAARAGGGPENVFLVINSRSWSSLTVANHYQRLRKIPASNVYYLDWSLDNERIDADTFRTKLLGPIIEEIGRRSIADHIDYVVYSTDFPWAIDFSAETKEAKLPDYLAPVASLNGATFLYQEILARRYGFLMLDANKYYRPVPRVGAPMSQGFHGWYGWGKDGRLLEAGGDRYLLSVMLGVTSGRGMATADVVRNLTRSIGADFARPAGTVYYCRNDDIRTKTRRDLFQPAVDALRGADVRGEIVDGVLPRGKPDVMGAMIGVDEFAWSSSGSTIRPGAICEHLTSSGGDLRLNAGQTPLTENLLNGAAGSSGAVVEPYAVPNKFPNAFIHLHYARGCSLAEAYYQAVQGPYQLLIVGDALCRPWADPPRVSVAGVEAGATIQGEMTLTPSAKSPADAPVARYELYVDGVFTTSCENGAALRFDTRSFVDGYHELRVMAVCTEPIETRGGILIPVTVGNYGRSLVLERVDTTPVRWGAPLRLRVKTDEAVGIIVAQGSRTLAKLRGNGGEISIDPKVLGLGPVALQAAAVGHGGPASNVLSNVLEFEVLPNEPLTFEVPRGSQFKPGLKLTQDRGEPSVVLALPADRWLADLGVTPGESFALSGLFSADRDGEYQFQFRHAMKVKLTVDGASVYDSEHAETAVDYVPVSLKAGLHQLMLEGTAGENRGLDVRFGFAGVARLTPAAMTHIP